MLESAIHGFGGAVAGAGALEVGQDVLGRDGAQLADQCAGVASDDPDVEIVDQEGDSGSGASGAEAEVVQSAVVPEGDAAAGVDDVVADPVVRGDLRSGRDCLGRAA